MWSSDHGLRVAPKASDSVNGKIVSSGTCVLPMTIAPAARSARTTSASRSRGPPCDSEPHAVTSPATSVSSLIATGTPSSGRRSPAPRRASAWSASVSARSASTTRKALSSRVQPPDALERRLDELARGDLAGGHQARLLGGAGEGEVGGVHGAGEH